MYLSFNYY